MSGKEATVYVVRCGGDVRCAKVYKEANKRNFRQASLYQEGRKTQEQPRRRARWKRARASAGARRRRRGRTSRSTRCTASPRPACACRGRMRSRGRRAHGAGPDADGHAAPRLNDVVLPEEVALAYHAPLIAEIVRMLCAGVIHGDLSEYNVLVDRDGPVIIDLPQAVDAAGNNNAASMLQRDVDNITDYFSRFAPALASTQYGKEIWSLYERGTAARDRADRRRRRRDATRRRRGRHARDRRRRRRARGAAALQGGAGSAAMNVAGIHSNPFTAKGTKRFPVPVPGARPDTVAMPLASFVNLVGAIMALAMLTVAARPPDDDHLYGHSKAEYFASGVEGR